jgi:hypothetical protein
VGLGLIDRRLGKALEYANVTTIQGIRDGITDANNRHCPTMEVWFST